MSNLHEPPKLIRSAFNALWRLLKPSTLWKYPAPESSSKPACPTGPDAKS
jgi:hypothetical protein